MPGEPKRVPILRERDVVSARQEGRDLARSLGFGSADQTRLATAISELTRNVLQHAGSGSCLLRDASNGSTIRLEVEVVDEGPGIADLPAAMRDGYSSGGGLGAGLPGARRLVNEFEIDTAPGHTRVRIAIVRKRTP